MIKYTSAEDEKKEDEDPVKKLEEIENKYKNMDYLDAPESLGLEKKEYKDLTDEEILEFAKDKVGNKEDGAKKISDNYSKKIETLESSTKDIEESSKAAKEKINKTYDASSKNISNDALKRGLARSSIVIAQIAGIENNRAKELTAEMENINSRLKSVEDEISSLNAEKEKALDDFDLSYAKAIEKAIEDKKDELLKQKQEVIEFNNKVDSLEAEYKITLDKQRQAKIKSNMEMKEKYGYTPDELKMEDEKYNYMIGYLDTLDKNEAINLLLNDEKIQSLLGEKFMAVYAYTRNRKN